MIKESSIEWRLWTGAFEGSSRGKKVFWVFDFLYLHSKLWLTWFQTGTQHEEEQNMKENNFQTSE